MPKIEAKQIVFEPLDRQAIAEQSPGIDASSYTALFNSALQDGDTTKYFKFLEEIKEKDPDILQAIETRSSYITSKEWTILQEDSEDGEQDENAKQIEKYLRDIKGDKNRGLMTVDALIGALLGDSYLIGLSFNEIVADDEQIIGFNHIPGHFLTFRDAVYYPKLWSQDNHDGDEFVEEKMISHYLTTGIDPARGWLGNGVAWQYVFKRMTMEERIRFEGKYGKGFLQLNMPGERDSFEEDWANAERLINNIDDVDGVVFGSEVDGEFKEIGQSDGQYFFDAEEGYKRDIAKIILGQESTSSAVSSNRSTAEVHMEVLEKRILEDSSGIEDTLTNQLIDKVKALLNISDDQGYEFKFVMSEMEATMDGDLAEDGAVEDDSGGSETQETTQIEDDTDER